MSAATLNIAVIFGGASMERDVSVASAAQVVPALRGRGHAVTVVDLARGVLDAAGEAAALQVGVDRAPPSQLREHAAGRLTELIAEGAFAGFDVVFLALHGGAGENGTVQALLSAASVPFTGTGQLGSALAMDKDLAKRLFRCGGVPTADWAMAAKASQADIEQLGLPLIVKPNSEGSTVGLTLVRSYDELQPAIEEAQRFDAEVMLERYVAGRELTVGVLDGRPLSVGEIIPAHGGLFDYSSKYQAGGAAEIFPADVSKAVTVAAQTYAVKVAELLKIDNYCRVDYRLDTEESLWCLEANTLPGMTAGSLLPRSAAASGLEFAQLCERICELALGKGGS